MGGTGVGDGNESDSSSSTRCSSNSPGSGSHGRGAAIPMGRLNANGHLREAGAVRRQQPKPTREQLLAMLSNAQGSAAPPESHPDRHAASRGSGGVAAVVKRWRRRGSSG
eukprot:NODE_5232_length_601_cov_138.318681.p3 GENE.NODE_5232_length_601_cov_138.318681~~NODE_5232_length_601_cov_138.318681.p3  ORF type:complete len:110 (+),score=24.72 NODE_5232_length_601_cov_138.318681:3-332(+)